MKWDPWQKAFLQCKGDKILCTGRQVGKSEVCAADASEYAVNNPKTKPIVMIAPLEKQAYALFDKALAYLTKHYPRLICKGKDKPTKTRIKLTTGVEIFCLPIGATGMNVRFLTIGRLYIDEASRVPAEAFVSVDPALLTTGGATIMLSTLNGANGDFYDCWINKDGAFDSFTRFSANSEVVIEEREVCASWTQIQRDGAKAKLERAKKRMSKAVYAQEYLGVAMMNLKRVFSDELIKKVCVVKRRGEVLINRKHYTAADISGMGNDETDIVIMDKISEDMIIQIDNIISKRVYTTETSEKIIKLHGSYHFKGIGIDDNGVGYGVFSELMRDSQTKKKTVSMSGHRRIIDEDNNRTKTTLMEEMFILLIAYMEQGRVKLLDDDEVIESLQSMLFNLVEKPGQLTRTVISGNYSHAAIAIAMCLYLAVQDKTLNFFVK